VSRLVSHIRPSSIDFLFIDGDHHYEAVRREYQLYAPLVREGGIIGFHDTNNRGIDGVEVDHFMRELDERISAKTADFRTDRKSPGTRLIWV
jgi:predicted O-methyltransferase YrrM